MDCDPVSQGQGGELVAAAALSVFLAQGKTAEQINLLSALFEIVGDNLALLALKVPGGETGQGHCPVGSGPAVIPSSPDPVG